jgi:hypothetical protein
MVMDSDVYRVGTSSEIADMWGITPGAVILAIARNRLPARKSLKVWIIAFSDAEAYFGRPANYYPSPESPKDSDN